MKCIYCGEKTENIIDIEDVVNNAFTEAFKQAVRKQKVSGDDNE